MTSSSVSAADDEITRLALKTCRRALTACLRASRDLTQCVHRPRTWLQRVSQRSHSQQHIDACSDTPPPPLYDNLVSPSRIPASNRTHAPAVHDVATWPPQPLHAREPQRHRLLKLIAAALSHNGCLATEAFRGAWLLSCVSITLISCSHVAELFDLFASDECEVITGNQQAMEFVVFVAACNHLLGQQVACLWHCDAMDRLDVCMQNIHLSELELERCFEFIRNGDGVVDEKKWVAALDDPDVQAAAAVVISGILPADAASGNSCTSHNVVSQHSIVDQPRCNRHRSDAGHQQQDIPCVPTKDYWMAKCGGEVKKFEWYFIERRRWQDPVDTWLSSKEMSVLGREVGRLFAVPMNQTTKGLMRQWAHLKLANNDASGDIGYKELQHLLKVCCIRAPEAEVKRIFEGADEDGSGSIDSVEFLTIVKTLQTATASTGVDACNFVRAAHGPSEALGVVLACTHRTILAHAGSSGQRECMFHVEIDVNETRACELLVSFAFPIASIATGGLFRLFQALFPLTVFFPRRKRRWISFAAPKLRRGVGLQVATLGSARVCSLRQCF